MTQLLSFHNDPKIKALYVKRIMDHAKADELIKGKYWEGGKGCAVGCTIHSSRHKAYEEELGIPEWLALLEDSLFEGLDNGDAKKFAVDFLVSIPVGINLEPVKWKFCAFILKGNIKRVLRLKITGSLKEEVAESIRGVLNLHESAIVAGTWPAWAAKSAARSAWSAAESAESAVESAESAESAKSAARSAWSATESAWSAAWSAAESAAESAKSAARSAGSPRLAAYKRYADELIRLLNNEVKP